MLRLLLALVVTLGVLTPSSAAEITVFGYLPEYRLGGFDYDAAFQSGLTHLIYFSLEIDTVTSLPSALDRLPSKEQAKQARDAADKVGGKVLIGFGGNARSQGFGKMATSRQRRAAFLVKLQEMMTEYGFDGVDYNWEYPANANEWMEWGNLMRETRELNSGKAIVTFTMYLDPNHYQVITQFKLLDVADFVHCMAYDQHGKHSTMEFAKQGIQLARKNKFDVKKFTLGVPFYSRHVQNGHPMTYQEVVKYGIPDDKTDQVGPHYFNSRATIRRKTQMAAKNGIGGIMIWELGQDLQPMNDPASLMTAIQEGLPGRDEL